MDVRTHILLRCPDCKREMEVARAAQQETTMSENAPNVGRDRLDMKYINSLALPLWDGDWPVYDIDVETGLYRIDVCGLLEVRHIDRCHRMNDSNGKTHFVGDFELDPEQWEERTIEPTSANPAVEPASAQGEKP